MIDKVKRRAVFYLGGFDPRGGRHYYSTYKEESTKMAKISEASIDVSSRKREKANITRWDIQYKETDSEPVNTVYRTLDYDDIIRRHWPKTETEVVLKMIRVYFLIWRKNGFSNEWNIIKPIVYTATFWLTIVTGLTLGGLSLSTYLWFSLTISPLWKASACILGFFTVWQIGKILDKKFNHYWLIRALCFSASQEQYDDPCYEKRMRYFADQVIEADKSEEFDEILVIGHSVGSTLAMETLSRATQYDTKLGTRKSEVNLITLGNCIALMSGTTLNKGCHEHLLHLSKCSNIDWVDIGARIDMAASFMIDMVKLMPCAKNNLPDKYLPRLKKVELFRLFDDDAYKKLKADRFRTHFQYLLASDKDGAYNYFRMTGGCTPLRIKFPL